MACPSRAPVKVGRLSAHAGVMPTDRAGWIWSAIPRQPKLTLVPDRNGWPVWTPDDRNIVFRLENPDAPGMYIVPSGHSREPQRLTDTKPLESPYSIAS